MKALNRVERDSFKESIAEFSVGDTVKVHVRVKEGGKERLQVFQGTVIGRSGGGVQETFIVRKISGNIAVERIFPLHSPSIEQIERVRQGRVRRAQLTYMKDRRGKRARVGELRADSKAAAEALSERKERRRLRKVAAAPPAADGAKAKTPEAPAEAAPAEAVVEAKE